VYNVGNLNHRSADAWSYSNMKTKECPSCAMEVDKKSKICPICNYEFAGRTGGIKWLALFLVLLFLLYLIFL